jgi:hypothetical protein
MSTKHTTVLHETDRYFSESPALIVQTKHLMGGQMGGETIQKRIGCRIGGGTEQYARFRLCAKNL